MKNMAILVLTLLLGVSVFAQPQKDSLYHAKLKQPGVQMVSVHNNQYKVFTQKIGDGKIKLLLLHGGPANGHEYFENFPAHLAKKGVTVYYFDQLGSYYSDSPLDSTAFTPEAFVEQVEEVRQALGLQNFYLLGHSWGGMLAELYARKYQQHLKGLILSNVPGYYFSPDEKTRPYSDSLTNLLIAKTYEAPALRGYPAAVLDSVMNRQTLADTALSRVLRPKFFKAFDSVMVRLTYYRKDGPQPDALVRNNRHTQASAKNPHLARLTRVYHRQDYKSALLALQTKTLLLGSANDYMYPQGYYDMQKAMAGAKVRVHITPNGSHFAMWDDTESYFAALTRFIKDVEKGRL